jgi:hypothetical protein
MGSGVGIVISLVSKKLSSVKLGEGLENDGEERFCFLVFLFFVFIGIQ